MNGKKVFQESRSYCVAHGRLEKTTLIKTFANNYTHSIILNLEKAAYRQFFEDFDDVKNILEALFLSFNISSDKINETFYS